MAATVSRSGKAHAIPAHQPGPQAGRKIGDRYWFHESRPILLSQHPESRSGLYLYDHLIATRIEDIATKSQEHEVSVAEPFEQLLYLLDFGSAPLHGELRLLQIGHDVAQLLEHGMKVFGRLPQQPKVLFRFRSKLLGLFRRECTVEYEKDRRQPVAVRRPIRDSLDASGFGSSKHEDGVEQWLDRQ